MSFPSNVSLSQLDVGEPMPVVALRVAYLPHPTERISDEEPVEGEVVAELEYGTGQQATTSRAACARVCRTERTITTGMWSRLEDGLGAAAVHRLRLSSGSPAELKRVRHSVARALNASGTRDSGEGRRRSKDEHALQRAATDSIVDALRLAIAGEQPGPAGPAPFDERLEDRSARYLCLPPPDATVDGVTVNRFADTTYIQALPKDGTKGHLLEREALAYGLDCERFPNGSFVARDTAGAALNFKWGRSPIASGVSLALCSYKEATRELLTRVGVPVPSGRTFASGDVEGAVSFAHHLGFPVVCKPVAGLRGIGVVANIRDETELRRALKIIARSEMGDDDFVVERHISGEDYRIVVIGGRVVASVRRDPASVTGDGQHTVLDLIEYKNRIRLENPHLRTRLIRLGGPLTFQLEKQGLGLDSVPEAGRKVVLANSANLSQGGDSVEVTEELHPSIRETALKAVDSVPGLGFCGLDMLLEDHTRSLDEQSAAVIELNAHAAIGSAQYPAVGRPKSIAEEFLLECAERHGVALSDTRKTSLSVEIAIRGRVTEVGYRRWFAKRALEWQVTGWIRNDASSRVRARLEGPTDAVSALCYLASIGSERAAPSSVHVSHTPPEGFATFEQQREPHRLTRLGRRVGRAMRHRSFRIR